MRKTTLHLPRGIQWTLFSHLEDNDFADDLAVLSATPNNLQEKLNQLSNFAKQTVYQVLKRPKWCMSMTLQHPRSSSVEKNDFTCLGSLISSDNGAHKDITARLNTAMCVFILLATSKSL